MTITSYYGAGLTHYTAGDYNLAGVNIISKLNSSIDYLSVTSTIAALNNVIGLAVVPSSAILNDITITNEAMDSNIVKTLTVDVGLYTIDASGILTLVANSATVLASASTILQAANTAFTTIIDPAVLTIDKRNNRLFQVAGLSADPGINYVIGIKIHAAAATAVTGKLAWRVSWLSK